MRWYHGCVVLTGAAAGALGCWVVLLVLLVLRRPAGTDGTGDEPPAVVNFLDNRCDATRVGYPATILDLAARGYLSVVQRAPGELWCGGPRGAVDVAPLNRIDAHVLTQVGDRLSGVDGAPFAALAGARSGVPEQVWWQPFRRLVRTEARERGLVVRRLSGWARLVLLAAAVPVGLLAVRAAHAYGANGPGTAGWVALVGFPIVVFGVASGDKATRAGRHLARWWNRYRDVYRVGPGDPDLARAAYAVALNISHPATEGYDKVGQEPSDAWSSFGGNWRLVPISGTPHRIRRPPVVSPILGGLATFNLVVLSQVSFLDLGKGLVWLALGVAALWSFAIVRTAMWLAQRAATPPVVDFDGQLIARWQVEEGDENTTIVHYGAIDDGSTACTFVLNSLVHQRLPIGTSVHVRANPRRGTLIELAVLGMPRAPARLAPVLAANPTLMAMPVGAPLPPVTPADLFSDAEVARVLGRDVRAIRRRPNSVMYRAGRVRLHCLVYDGPALAAVAVLGSAMIGAMGTPVPEFGMGASMVRQRSLMLRIGPASAVQLSLHGMPARESGPALIALGRIALANLTNATAEPPTTPGPIGLCRD
jgi:hypothetical protein